MGENQPESQIILLKRIKLRQVKNPADLGMLWK